MNLDMLLIRNGMHENVKCADKNGVVALTARVNSESMCASAEKAATGVPNKQQFAAAPLTSRVPSKYPQPPTIVGLSILRIYSIVWESVPSGSFAGFNVPLCSPPVSATNCNAH